MEFDIGTKYRMNNSLEIPALGIGTWDMHNEKMKQALQWAFEFGYRHIDTATYYKNEKEVGEAVRDSSVPREEIFVTTKVWPNDFGFKNCKKAFENSYKLLDLDYIDLYLIHWPSEKKRTNDTWRAMLELHNDDRLKSIGVSNYSINEIETLKDSGDVQPVTNQVKFHPYSFDAELLEYCKSEKILLTAYSPLVEGKKLREKKLIDISSHYNKSPAQVLIRWGLQKGIVEIPKSSNKGRIEENASIYDFKIDNNDMDDLDNF